MSQSNSLVTLLERPADGRSPRINAQGHYEVHLDRDGAAFRYVLNFLRNNKLPKNLPDTETAIIYQEAEHFNVVELKNEIKHLYRLREEAREQKTANPLEHLCSTLLLSASLVSLGKIAEARSKITKLHHRWPMATASIITNYAVAHLDASKSAYLFGFATMQTQPHELRMPYFISLAQRRMHFFFSRGTEGLMLAKAGLMGASHQYLYKTGQLCSVESPEYLSQRIRMQDLAEGRDNAVVTAAQKYLEKWPNSAPLHSLLGTALIELGRFNEAQRALRRAIQIDDTSYTDYAALIGLGRCLLHEHQYAEALMYCMQAYPYEPFNAGLTRTIASTMCRINAYQDAESWFRAAGSLLPHQAMSYCDIGQTLALQGKFLLAKELYQTAITLDPNDAFIRARMADACEALQDWADAEIHRKRVIEILPGDAVARCAMGRLLLEIGRPLEALAHYDRAVELAPQLVEAHKGQQDATEAMRRPAAQRIRRDKRPCIDPKRLQLPTIAESPS